MKKILLVEDEEMVREGLSVHLSKAGYQIQGCGSIAEFEKQKDKNIDLVIMDWELPDGEGINAIKKLRGAGDTTPVIMLTARSEVIDKVLGFELGANDYLTKPFEIRELLARIKNQLKESRSEAKLLTVGEITMDLFKREVTFNGKILELTRMEHLLLQFFMENVGKALARDEILDEVWGANNFPSTRTVDVHITMLRQKIGNDYIETLRGVGYRFGNKR